MKLLLENWRKYLQENLTMNEISNFSDILNDKIITLLFEPSTIAFLNKQPEENEATTIINADKPFAFHDTIKEIHLGISTNDKGQGVVGAQYLCLSDRTQSNLVITIDIPRHYNQLEEFKEWLEAELDDALAHELQHSCDPTDMLSDDIPEGEAKWESIENLYKHFASEAETRAHITGILGGTRKSGQNPEEIIQSKISLIYHEAIDRGLTKNGLPEVLQNIWEKWMQELDRRT